MKILDRYILLEFIRSFFGILAVFAMITLLHQVLGVLGDLRTENPDMYSIMLYFANELPGQMLEVVPISTILAVMFGLGALAKKKELLAIHASGISYFRLAAPIVIAMALIALGAFYVSENFVPGCRERAEWLERVKIKGKDEATLSKNKNVTARGKGNVFYDMKSYDSQHKIMQNPVITKLYDDGHTIMMRLDAKYAELVETNPKGSSSEGDPANGGKIWRFHKAVRRTFDSSNALIKQEVFDDKALEIPMEDDLDKYLANDKDEKEMSLGELKKQAEIQAERSENERLWSLQMERHNRYAFAFASFLLGLIGYTFAVRSSIRSFVMEFGMALVYVASYYVLLVLGQRLGGAGLMPAILASWYTNIVFLGILIWRFRNLHHVPKR